MYTDCQVRFSPAFVISMSSPDVDVSPLEKLNDVELLLHLMEGVWVECDAFHLYECTTTFSKDYGQDIWWFRTCHAALICLDYQKIY